jgi:hypothetical protein
MNPKSKTIILLEDYLRKYPSEYGTEVLENFKKDIVTVNPIIKFEILQNKSL